MVVYSLLYNLNCKVCLTQGPNYVGKYATAYYRDMHAYACYLVAACYVE